MPIAFIARVWRNTMHWVQRCRLALTISLLLVTRLVGAAAPEATVEGLWRTIDDRTHAPLSIVETSLQGGRLSARVKQVLQSPQGPYPRCEKCEGALHRAPVVGMRVMWDLVQQEGGWEGGFVLDPANGTVYRCRVRLTSPDRLEVRGFVGISLFGRSQTWERMPTPAPGHSTKDVAHAPTP